MKGLIKGIAQVPSWAPSSRGLEGTASVVLLVGCVVASACVPSSVKGSADMFMESQARTGGITENTNMPAHIQLQNLK